MERKLQRHLPFRSLPGILKNRALILTEKSASYRKKNIQRRRTAFGCSFGETTEAVIELAFVHVPYGMRPKAVGDSRTAKKTPPYWVAKRYSNRSVVPTTCRLPSRTDGNLPRAKKVSPGHFFAEVSQLPPPSSSPYTITKKDSQPKG